MLAELINKLWRGGHGNWKQDERVLSWERAGKPSWTYDEAIQAIQLETRIAERFFDMNSEQRHEVIELTAALIACGEVPAPIRGGFVICG